MNELLALGIVALLLLAGALFLAWQYQRSQRDARLADGERRELEELIDRANDALLVIDIGNGSVLRANARAAAMLGITLEQLHASTIFSLCPADLLDRCAERIAEAWEGNGAIYDDIPFQLADGTLLPVECSARVSDFGGRPAIQLYARDIRERLRLQQEITEQKAQLEQRNRDMLDSIQCASRIQQALVPGPSAWGDDAPEHFVFLRPRDIVSGDFHWFANRSGRLMAAAADCTGHGVPGALMSMIGATLLDRIVNERGITDPAAVLEQLRAGIIRAMAEERNEVDSHGMDIALIAWDPASRVLHFAGAQLAGLVLRTDEGGTQLIELVPDRMPVGQHPHQARPFTCQRFELRPGDAVYLFTDGICDQFGGPRSRRFSRAGVGELLQRIHRLPMEEQRLALAGALAAWRGDAGQTDDMLMIGLRA